MKTRIFLINTFLIISALIASCGGGGDKKNPTPTSSNPDSTDSSANDAAIRQLFQNITNP